MPSPGRRFDQSLTGFSQAELIDVLLDTSGSPETRVEAAFRLGTRTGISGKYNRQGLRGPLLTALSDDCPYVRSEAAHALNHIFYPLPPLALTNRTCLLDDEAPIVRSAAVLAIAGTDNSTSLVLKALQDPSAKVRQDAIFALGFLMPKEAKPAIPAIKAALRDPVLEVREWARSSLEIIGMYYRDATKQLTPSPSAMEEVPSAFPPELRQGDAFLS